MDVGVVLLIHPGQGLDHLARLLGRGGAVEIDQGLAVDGARQDREIGAHLRDVIERVGAVRVAALGQARHQTAPVRVASQAPTRAPKASRTATRRSRRSLRARRLDQHAIGGRPIDAAAHQIEHRLLVQAADRGAVAAAHVVGIDLELGLPSISALRDSSSARLSWCRGRSSAPAAGPARGPWNTPRPLSSITVLNSWRDRRPAWRDR